jgi:hypothetical protein
MKIVSLNNSGIHNCFNFDNGKQIQQVFPKFSINLNAKLLKA